MSDRKRRATVILLRRGDPEISDAIADGILAARGTTSSDLAALGHLPLKGKAMTTDEIGMVATPMPTDEIGMVAADMDRQHILPALREDMRRLDMMRHTPEELEAMILQARFDYGQDPPTPRWVARLLGLYGLLCLGISRAYRAQDRVLGRS